MNNLVNFEIIYSTEKIKLYHSKIWRKMKKGKERKSRRADK